MIVVPSWDGVYFYVKMSGEGGGTATALYALDETPTLLLTFLFSLQVRLRLRLPFCGGCVFTVGEPRIPYNPSPGAHGTACKQTLAGGH